MHFSNDFLSAFFLRCFSNLMVYISSYDKLKNSVPQHQHVLVVISLILTIPTHTVTEYCLAIFAVNYIG